MTTTPATNPSDQTGIVSTIDADRLRSLVATVQMALSDIEHGKTNELETAAIWFNWGMAKSLVRELTDQVEQAFVARMKEHGRIVWQRDDDGKPLKWLYAAPSKTTKSKDNEETMAVLIDLYGGDVVGMTECLSAQPFKHGAMRKKAQDNARFSGVCDDLFETVVTSKVKEGSNKGKAIDKVQVADD